MLVVIDERDLENQSMKRIGNIYSKIYDMANLILADRKARKGKSKQKGVIEYDKDQKGNLFNLQQSLINHTYKTSPYVIFKIRDPKEREIFRLPFLDRVLQHAVLNILEPMFVATLTANTYSCVKGRGTHKASYKLRESLKDVTNTKYCLTTDIQKFYPSVDHNVLKMLLRRKIKCKQTLWLLDGIIDSAPGVPIGNLLSQSFANFYLSPFDHWVKEELRVKHYFRYSDDMIFLASSKEELWEVLTKIHQRLSDKFKLTIKDNWQVFPVDIRLVDFVGYPTGRNYSFIRKRTKKRFAKMIRYRPNKFSIASYKGWSSHANTRNLMKKLL